MDDVSRSHVLLETTSEAQGKKNFLVPGPLVAEITVPTHVNPVEYYVAFLKSATGIESVRGKHLDMVTAFGEVTRHVVCYARRPPVCPGWRVVRNDIGEAHQELVTPSMKARSCAARCA